jgi:hypothetical protein
MQSPPLDGLVDRPDEVAMLGLGLRSVAIGDGPLEPMEERLDPRRVAAVLEAFALGARYALFLRLDVRQGRRKLRRSSPQRALL